MWLAVRVVCIAAWAMGGASYFGKATAFPMPYWTSLFALLGGALTMRLWVRPLFPWFVPTVSWAAPQWTANPFSLREPLQGFHLAAMCFIAVALLALAADLKQQWPGPFVLDAHALSVGAYGLGTYLGVLWIRRPAAAHPAAT